MNYPKEDQFQVSVVQFFQLHHIFCHSIPNELGGKGSGFRTSRFVAMGLRKGVADLIVWWPSGIGYLELKRDGATSSKRGKQSEFQKTFEKKCIEHNIPYDLAWNMKDIEKLLNKHK